MQALVYHGPGRKEIEEVPMPRIEQPGDAIVRILRTTICGTDLHILRGHVPDCAPGRILGHEGVGEVVSTGSEVHAFRPGDRVLISCISACGRCPPCRAGMYSHCQTGGWILGHHIDGTQAEYARIPHADTSLYALPPEVRDDAVLLSDILPTGYECGVLNGRVHPGCTVAIAGAGPIGLATLLTAQFFAPAAVYVLDTDARRLEFATRFGATATVVNEGDAGRQSILDLTGGRGVDTAIEAVGVPATFELCQEIVAPGGTIANVGVHGASVELHLERLWSHNIAMTTRLVDTITTPTLLRMMQAKRLVPEGFLTHRFPLANILEAYNVFENAASTGALKVLLSAGTGEPGPA